MSKFVCTWCARSFPTRVRLGAHWHTTPACRKNRLVSNQTQSKYGEADAPSYQPGEYVLRLVEAAERS